VILKGTTCISILQCAIFDVQSDADRQPVLQHTKVKVNEKVGKDKTVKKNS